MKEIPLTQDQVTLVDDEDFDSLSQNPWHAKWNPYTQSFYAKRTVWRGGKRITLYAHREIMGLEHGDPREVHHLNGDTLDNRRSNLEVLTVSEHKNEHRNDPRKDASQYGIGIRRIPSGRFEARARIDGKKHSLGTYDTPQEAQQARQDFLARLREETK